MPTAAMRKRRGKITELLRQTKNNIPMKAFLSGIVTLVHAGGGFLAGIDL